MPASQYIPPPVPPTVHLFQAKMGNAAQTIGGTGVYTLLQLNLVDFDVDGRYDNVLFRYTPNVAGTWFFTAQCNWNAGAAYMGNLRMYKNAAAYVSGTCYCGPSQGTSISLNCFMDMNGTTDYVSLYAGQGSGGNRDVNGGSLRPTMLAGWLIN